MIFLKNFFFLLLWFNFTQAFDLKFNRLNFYFVHGSSPKHHTFYTLANLTSVLSHPKFSLRKKTALFCHGWFDNFDSIGTQAIVRAYSRRGDHNFMVFDWGQYDVTLLPIAVHRSTIIAPLVGRALLELFEHGLNPQGFHCIGHSIGSHVCGTAGREIIVASFGRFKFQRITALDPAREFFHQPPILAAALTTNDAHFVDAIHTDGSNRGTPYRVGHVDFYPDGGMFQASCPSKNSNFITDFCSHWKALFYYAKSLVKERAYPARECSSFEQFKDGFCERNAVNLMGYPASPQAPGVFFLSIGKREAITRRDYLKYLKKIIIAIFTRNDVNLVINERSELFG